MKKSQAGSKSFTDGLRKVSPFLVFALVYYALAVLMKLSYSVWIPIALAVTIIEAIYVLGQLYKPFLVDKKGKCTASRDTTKTNSMEHCRHYSRGSQFGGCGRREENGLCRLRMR